MHSSTKPIALTSVFLGSVGLAAYATAGRSSQLFGASSYRGPGIRRSIALTFDDGPSPSSLPLLDYLASHHIRATFFQCGINVRRHPHIARATQQAGHEIGNHTYSHARMCPRIGWHPHYMTPAAIYREFELAQQIIQSETGLIPTLLRAPYGLRWFGLDAVQAKLGLHGVMWTVIGQDWRWPAKRIAHHVISRATPGGIICLHDGRDIQPNPDISACLSALRLIIPALLDQNYRFETVSEILQRRLSNPLLAVNTPASSRND